MNNKYVVVTHNKRYEYRVKQYYKGYKWNSVKNSAQKVYRRSIFSCNYDLVERQKKEVYHYSVKNMIILKSWNIYVSQKENDVHECYEYAYK